MQGTLIVIVGPTGVGKTDVCLALAEHYHLPVINADSRQIYAEMTIGTAAPTKEQLARARHYFVGTRHVADYYNASMYEQEVLSLLPSLFADRSAALLSGGSMMYVDAVCKGIDDIPTVTDETRRLLKERLAAEGLPALVDDLHRLDPDHWAVVDRQNTRRVVHALEICYQTGLPYSSFLRRKPAQRPFHMLKIGLTRPREELYERINRRVEQMVREGLIDEALRLYPYRYLNALNTVGYKEMFQYLDGIATLPSTILSIQSATRRYARKQLTWYKRDDSIRWFHPQNIEEILNYINANVHIRTI